MFAAISLNWRSRPLTSHEVVVQWIGHTRTKTGLTIQADLDAQTYEIGKKADPKEVARLSIERPEHQTVMELHDSGPNPNGDELVG